jgi:hypothetical protein
MPEVHGSIEARSFAQVGAPVAAGSGHAVLAENGVGHQIEQVLFIGDIAIQRRGSAAEFGGNAPDGGRSQTFRIGDANGERRDLLLAVRAGLVDGLTSGSAILIANSVPIMLTFQLSANAVLNLAGGG